MIDIKADLNKAAENVLQRQWNSNQGLLDLIEKLTQTRRSGFSLKGLFGSDTSGVTYPYFIKNVVQGEGQFYGVKLTYNDMETELWLTFQETDKQGYYAYESRATVDHANTKLNYKGRVETHNGAINVIQDWVTRIAVDCDIDLHRQIELGSPKPTSRPRVEPLTP